MKVVYILHYPGFGGANVACLSLMLRLRSEYGVEPICLVPMDGQVIKILNDNGIRNCILHYAAWRGPRSGIKGLVYAAVTTVVNAVCAFRVRKLLQGEMIDIIHGNTSLTGFAWFLAKLMKVPLVWHQREFGEEDYGLKYYYGKKIAGKMIGSSACVITVSKAMGDYYAEFVRPVSKLLPIYDGIDVEKIDRIQNEAIEAFGGSDEFRLCIVGGISPGKNQKDAIDALDWLKKHDKLSNIHFYIIGAGTQQYEKELKDYIAQLGLTDRVHFLGQKTNVFPYLKKMNCLLCCSLREGFGLSVVEGMYAGLPIVAARAGAMKELIEEGVVGYQYDLFDAEQLANRILDVKSGNLGPDQPNRSKQRVLDNYTLAKNTRSIYDVYKKALS